MWLTEYSEQMHNLKTRIKRRKEGSRKSLLRESSSSSKSSSVEADWQFVNFNPCMYGPRKSMESSESGATSSTNISTSNPNIATTGATASFHNSSTPQNNIPTAVTASAEDFYEFPSSANLKQIGSPSSKSPQSVLRRQASSNVTVTRDNEGLNRDPSLQKYLRHSITSTFDLLPNQIQVQGQYNNHHHQLSKHKPPDEIKFGRKSRPVSGLGLASISSSSADSVITVGKSQSVLSNSSSSSTASISTSGGSSNPVSRSSSRCTPASQSKFYVSSPLSRPPLPLPREATGQSRPHSWDVDSGTGTLIINGRDVISAKKGSRYVTPINQNHVNTSSASDKRKRSFYNEQANRKIPSHSKPKYMSPRIPRPPPIPSYSLEEALSGFPSQSSRNSLPPTFHNVSAIGSLCLSLINTHGCDRPSTGSGSSGSNLKGDKRPDTLNEERLENDGQVCEDDMNRVRQEPKKTTNAVGRSESCKEPQRKQPRERRKHSDPNLTSKSSDVDLDNQRLLSDANNSGSSSNSSLSARSLDSPNTSSLELVAQSVSSTSLRGRDSQTPDHSTVRPSEVINDSYKTSPGWDGDSDIEIEQDLPDWTKNVPEETISQLDRLEKKRQEVLNELFHTERLFVRKLKIMDRLFFQPMKSQPSLSSDLIHLLFPNLEEVLGVHDSFNDDLKRTRSESLVVGDIGPVLLEMFDGERGENFKQAASTFCSRQQIGLELLKEKRKRNMKFDALLTEAESDSVCRRLGIKDMIPSVMQRLTKYPILFENLCNCTAADSQEYKNLQRALELSKEILCSVNLAKKEAEDENRLQEIQKKLDKSFFEKGVERTDHAFSDLRNFDFTRHKLMYDGSLIWRINKSKGDRLKPEHQEVLVVLLEEMVVLLLKVDDRYVLKMHNIGSGKADRMPAKPIIKLSTLHATRVAADKRAFYLISKTSPTPFMFELVCTTPEERNIWLQHITKAADDYKSRQESRRSEVHPITNIPPSVSESEDRSKESSEVAEANGQEASDQSTDSGAQQEPLASTSVQQEDSSPTPDNPSNNPSGGIESPPQSPEKGVGGDGKLGVKGAQSTSPTSAHRKQGEFLRVTESSPLIDPSEVVVETTEVHFAKIIVSPHEEIKRADSKIQTAFDEKLKLISKMCHIPSETPDKAESSDASESNKPKDAKELVVACIHQVDQLGRLIATQKLTSENIQYQKEQLNIHKVLNSLLAQLLSEVHRKDEDLELRKQELHRIREQNHGYQERLQAKTKAEATLVSPVRSPSHSRPNSFVSLSSSSDHHEFPHDDEAEVVAKAPLKQQLSAPVASSSSNSTSPTPVNPDNAGSACENVSDIPQAESSKPPSNCQRGHHSHPASELAQEEFADALEDLVTTDWDSAIETNRESTETEVLASTNEICQQQEGSGQEQVEDISQSLRKNVPENKNGEIENETGTEASATKPVDGCLTNGHQHQEASVPSSDLLTDHKSVKEDANSIIEIGNAKTYSCEDPTTVQESSSVES